MNVVNFRDIILGDKVGRGASGEVRKCTFDDNMLPYIQSLGSHTFYKYTHTHIYPSKLEKKQTPTTNTGEGVEQREPTYTAGRDVN